MKSFFLLTFLLCFGLFSVKGQASFDITCSNKQPTSEKDFRDWVNYEVQYIASKEEKKNFRSLVSDLDKLNFINNFWIKRDPDSRTKENEYKTKFCQRVKYSKKFTSGVSGWKTDRGIIYILYGKPDKIERGQKDFGKFSNVVFENWVYTNLNDGNAHHEYIFTDPTETNEFRLTNIKREEILKRLDIYLHH